MAVKHAVPEWAMENVRASCELPGTASKIMHATLIKSALIGEPVAADTLKNRSGDRHLGF